MALVKDSADGVMIPIPQYPLYSASLALYGGRQIGYFLDEKNRWQLNETHPDAEHRRTPRDGTRPVALVVINPGNPTGAVLSSENVEMIVRFARTHALSLIADEVYQENVYDPNAAFHSFTRIMARIRSQSTSSLSRCTPYRKGFLANVGTGAATWNFATFPTTSLHNLSNCSR